MYNKALVFSLAVCFVLIFSGCGQKGALFLPEEKQSELPHKKN